ncbi:MAG: PAS domain S-box protein [Bacteroidia bacterium]|nr:PAS domain S-box protein [Bacteroidia bacterium]
MRNAIKIAFIYLAFGVFWILLGDWLAFSLLGEDIARLESVQKLKGILYVLISALLVFFLTHRAIRTITKQKQLQGKVVSELKKSEEKYRLLFQNNPVPIVIFGVETHRFLEVNQAAIAKYGYSREEFLNMIAWDLLSTVEEREVRKQFFKDNVSKFFAGGHTENVSRHISKDGSFLDVKIFSYYQPYQGEPAIFNSILDISKEKLTEQQIISEVIKATEDERERISMEIHDNLIQVLGVASMNLKNLPYDMKGLDEIPKYQKALNYLNNGINLSRSISHQLMPKSILDFGLIPGISEMIEEFQAIYPIKIHFVHEETTELNPEITINIFRIVQEALNNIQKHAEATEISIRLFIREKVLSLEIEDNGKGVSEEERIQFNSGLGLRIMQNRAIRMKGFFSIQSKVGEGTKLLFSIPLKS